MTQSVIRTADIIVLLQNLLAQKSAAAEEELIQLLDRAWDIDAGLERWTESIPAHWEFIRRRDRSWTAEVAFEGRCDVYYDLQVASNWNCYRRTRLVLLECIVQAIHALRPLPRRGENEHGPDPYRHREREALHAIAAISLDMCASVPFHLGTRNLENNDVRFPALDDPEAAAIHRQIAPLQGWSSIVLPLSRLVKSKFIVQEQHDWAVSQYDRICAIVGHKHGISAAHTARIFASAVSAFASALPINSRHLRYV